MAQQPKQRKLDEWLQAKLEDNWGGDNISQLLGLDHVSEIAQEWDMYESQIRVKILIAILNIRKKQQLSDLKDQLDAIIAKGLADPDEWVCLNSKLDRTGNQKQVPLGLLCCPVRSQSWLPFHMCWHSSPGAGYGVYSRRLCGDPTAESQACGVPRATGRRVPGSAGDGYGQSRGYAIVCVQVVAPSESQGHCVYCT